MTIRVSIVALTMPPTMGAAMRRITSDPVPLPSIMGNNPPMTVATVIMIGRTRRTATTRQSVPSAARPVDLDPRIEQVVGIIRGEPDRSHSVERLAETVHVSPSRLTHLFREQVRVPIRRFTVWSRTRQVIHLAVDGATLTEAAHSAGYSDAAHMSNTFRQMFGFAPSVLFTTRVPKDVHILN